MILDTKSFEAAIVRHCSPTLAGIKPGCLFNVPGVFAADLNEKPAVQLEQWRSAKELCTKLDCLVAKTSSKLKDNGIEIRVIAHRHCGALIYVWRPTLLKETLSDSQIKKRLIEWGYTEQASSNLNNSIERLGRRLELCQLYSTHALFPHEIGFFLGYPYADVMGFIEHNGQDYLCCGCWKVYTNQEKAEACFARYKQCTQDFMSMYTQGITISEIAQTCAA